jgi:hypothetical protein
VRTPAFKIAATLVLAIAAPVLLKPSQGSQNAAVQSGFVGAGGCSANTCHGSVFPKAGDGIQQNEYYVWSTKDKHAKAYNVLLEPRSQNIARNLGLDRPESANLCLDCHTSNAPADQRSTTFQLSDGVGCESCHGPARAWLGEHTRRDWKPEQSLQHGMIDTRDLQQRAKGCLSCHLGDDKKTVDHTLIAAGHPDLLFELDTFSVLMPPHWKKKTDLPAVRQWAVGQAVMLRESMTQLALRAKGKAWDSSPEFADFECSACHHNLVTPSARQARGYAGRPGSPPWNEMYYTVFRNVLTVVSEPDRQSLDQAVAQLKKELEGGVGRREQVAQRATAVALLANRSIPKLSALPADSQSITRIIRSIATDNDAIAAAGMRTAAQATWAVDSLQDELSATGEKTNEALKAQIDMLYGSFQNQAYDPERFSSALKAFQK